jgi:hypothetical protein
MVDDDRSVIEQIDNGGGDDDEERRRRLLLLDASAPLTSSNDDGNSSRGLQGRTWDKPAGFSSCPHENGRCFGGTLTDLSTLISSQGVFAMGAVDLMHERKWIYSVQALAMKEIG